MVYVNIVMAATEALVLKLKLGKQSVPALPNQSVNLVLS